MLGLKTILSCIFAVFLLLSSISSVAAEPAKAEPSTYVEILLDASGSMQAQIGKEAKIAIAKKVLGELVDSMKGREDLAIGVRVYGHQFDKSVKNCQDSKLEIPFGKADPAKVRDLISRIKAQGQTPIAYSLNETAKDFPTRADIKKLNILITDGLESCDGDPCAAAKAIAAKGVDVKMHVVGFDLKTGELEKLKCLVDPSGGLLLGAKNASELKDALGQVVKKSLKENLAVTLLGSDGKPIAGYIEIYEAGTEKKIDACSAGGAGTGTREKATAKVPAGTYDLLAISHVTSEKQWLRAVKVTDEEVTEKTISFASGQISGIGKSTSGAPVPAYFTVLKNDGVEDKFVTAGLSGAAPVNFSVVPGTYKLKVAQDRTKEEKVFDGLVITGGGKISKEVTFAEGSVNVIAKDMAGKPIAMLTEVKRVPSDDFFRAGYGGATGFNFYLAPGTYRFTVTNEKTKEAKIIDQVAVTDGGAITKEVNFGEARLSVIAKDASGTAIPASVEIIRMDPTGSQRTLYLEDSGNEPRQFTVSPGTYKIVVRNKATTASKTLENVIITDQQDVKKEVGF